MPPLSANSVPLSARTRGNSLENAFGVYVKQAMNKGDCGGNPGPFGIRRFGLVKVSWTEK